MFIVPRDGPKWLDSFASKNRDLFDKVKNVELVPCSVCDPSRPKFESRILARFGRLDVLKLVFTFRKTDSLGFRTEKMALQKYYVMHSCDDFWKSGMVEPKEALVVDANPPKDHGVDNVSE